jgi:hypothetical protein
MEITRSGRFRQKPIALFIDDAHDLHSKTLIGEV